MTGDFNKALNARRGLSPLEEEFAHANAPWSTSGVRPLWGSGATGEWPDLCGFDKLPGTDDDWKIRKHESFKVDPESFARRPPDRTCHYEQ